MQRGSIILLIGLAAIAVACSGDHGGAGAPCKANNDCAVGEICVASTCRAGKTPVVACTNDGQCGLGEFCDTAVGLCAPIMVDNQDAGTTTGDAGSSTTADAGIRDGGGNGSCAMDNECGTPPVDICVGNTCVKGCGEPDGVVCTGGTVCDSPTGHCITPMMMCNMDSDCMPPPPTQICENNQCVFGCGLDASLCDATEICDTGTGRCVTAPMNCAMDSECNPPLTVCEVPQCVPGCNQAGGIQCAAPTPTCDAATGRCVGGPTCTLDADCTGANEICVNMACVVRCDAPGGLVCNAPNVCNPATGRCAAGNLPLGDPCSFDAECSTDLCLGLTIGGMSMPVCAEPCGATSDCPLNFNCSDVSGMTFCLGENLTTPPATWDTPSGGACSTTTNTCQSGWCNTGASVCLETCQRSSHCTAFGGNCWTYEQTGTTTTYDHLCYDPGSGSAAGAACTTNANCRSGICDRYSSRCAAHCCRDADCGGTQNCGVYDLDATTIVKICADKSTTAGATALGATCAMASDCDSEVCAPVDPANMASPLVCSTTCCTDADCAKMPVPATCTPLGGPVTNTIVGVCIPN